MNKLKLLFLSLIACLMVYQVNGESQLTRYDLNTVHGKFQYLMSQHQQFMQAQNALFSKFEKEFFSNLKFIGSDRTRRFFTNLERSGQGNFYGSMVVSHIQMSIINGKRYTVHYTYQSDGKNVEMTKYINNNGKVLKADYSYDMSGKLLKAEEYKNKKLVQKKLYKI